MAAPDYLLKACRAVLEAWQEGDLQSAPETDEVNLMRWFRAAVEEAEKDARPAA